MSYQKRENKGLSNNITSTYLNTNNIYYIITQYYLENMRNSKIIVSVNII